MIRLSPEQLVHIKSKLTELGLSQDVQEELLDHLASLTEVHMAEGISFSKAHNKAFAILGKDEIQDINQSILSLHKKSTFMKVLTLSCTALVLAAAAFFIFEIPDSGHPQKMTTLIPATEDSPALEVPVPNDFFIESLLTDPPSIKPVKNARLTSSFGMRMHPISKIKRLHRGIDFAAPMGTPVVATADGKVEKTVIKTEGYGKHLVIKHDSIYSTLYAQLSKILVQEGQSVQKGDTIGLVGSSGASTAPHLHYEVIKQGTHVDPEHYFHP